MDEHVEALLDDIYEASIDSQLWWMIARKMKQLCPESEVEILFFDQVTSSMPCYFSSSNVPDSVSHRSYYETINSLWPVMKDLKPGQTTNTDFLNAPNRIGHTEYYNDFLVPNNADYLLGGNFSFVPGTIGGCAIGYSSKVNKKHTLIGEKLLSTLLPHIQRSFDLSRKYAGLEAMPAHYQDRVDAFSNPAFLLRADGKIDYMNNAAEKAICEVRGIKSDLSSKLSFCNKKDQEEFETLLKHHLSKDDQEQKIAAIKGVMTFQVWGEGGINLLSLIPVSGRRYNDASILKIYAQDNARKVMVILQYEKDNKKRMVPLLQKYFLLTPTECRIALALMTGLSVEQYVEKTNGNKETVRKHVARIFKKTSTHHQGELIAMLSDHKQIFFLK